MKRATVYLKSGSFYIYASSRATKGFWIASEPFFRVESEYLGDKVLEVLNSSRLGVETPDNTEDALDQLIQPILKLSDSGNWDEFLKDAKCCHLSLKGDEFKAMPTKRSGQEFRHQPKLSVAGSVGEVSELLDKAFHKSK